MKKGFSHGVAPDLIRERPGMTSRQVAELAMDRDLSSSDSKVAPVFSLSSTLAKEVREGRLPEVVARKERGVLRYYPAGVGESGTGETSYESDGMVSIRLPLEQIQIADQLVQVDKFGSRSEALAWLVAEGVVRNRDTVNKVNAAVQRIRAIKSSL